MPDSKKTDPAAADRARAETNFRSGMGPGTTLGGDLGDRLADQPALHSPARQSREAEPTGPSRAQLAADFLGEPARLAALTAKYAAPPPADYDDLQPAQARPSDISDFPRPSFWIGRPVLIGARGTRDSVARKQAEARLHERLIALRRKYGQQDDADLYFHNLLGDPGQRGQALREMAAIEAEEKQRLEEDLAATPRPAFGGVGPNGRPFWYGTGDASSFMGAWCCRLGVLLVMEPGDFAAALKHCRTDQRHRYGRSDRALVILGWEPDVSEVTAIEATGAALEHLGAGFERWLKQQTGRPARAGL